MQITITRKRMKTMRISVDPTDGKVKVSAPKRVSEKQIQDFIDSRIPRIKKAHDFYAQSKELLKVEEGKVLLHGEGYVISSEHYSRHPELFSRHPELFSRHPEQREGSLGEITFEKKISNT